MKRAVIFVNGKRPKKSRVFENLKKTDTVICADGGLRHALAFGITPRVIIGDKDSIPKTVFQKLQGQKVKWITHPKEKDKTDSELAVEYALEKGFDELLIFSISGSRLDHLFGNIMFLTHHTKDAVITIIEDTQDMYIVKNDNLTLTGKKGDYVSIFPMSENVSGITTKNLKWELTKGTIPYAKTYGISNELTKETGTISVTSGTLFVIHTRSKR